MQTTDRNVYGTLETAGLVDARAYHQQLPDNMPQVGWATPGLKVTRLRLLSDPGFPVWDVSYCHGTLDGQPVRVDLPFSQLPKRRIKEEIIKHAKRDRVYALGLGIFDSISTLC